MHLIKLIDLNYLKYCHVKLQIFHLISLNLKCLKYLKYYLIYLDIHYFITICRNCYNLFEKCYDHLFKINLILIKDLKTFDCYKVIED